MLSGPASSPNRAGHAGLWELPVEVPVNGGTGNAECLGDLGQALATGTPGAGGGELVAGHDGGSAAGASVGARGRQPGHDALLARVALKFGERCHDGEE